MLKEDVTDKRKERHAETQEDFTPPEVLSVMFQHIDDNLYTDFSKTFCDPGTGTGNIFLYVLERRLHNCKTEEDKIRALSSMYGIELMQDNVDECKERIYKLVGKTPEIEKIVNHNIVCSDFFKWDFENWRPIPEAKSIELF